MGMTPRVTWFDAKTREKILAEARYFRGAGRASFERTYGWAWLLKLAEETGRCPDPAAGKWSGNLQPLVQDDPRGPPIPCLRGLQAQP